MGLLAKIFGNGNGTENERYKNRSSRICRIEELESRDLLNGVGLYEPPDPINVGVVYHEDYHVSDHREEDGETFVVGWNGGLDGTTLDQIVIDLTKNTAKYPYSANIYFNTEFDFNWELSQNAGNGINVTSWSFSQDGRTLTINFDGFTAGKQFFFNIDVDEVTGEVDHPIDKLVTGKEMEGATITGKFHVENDNYEKDLPFEIGMVDKYDSASAGAAGVPEDNYEAVLGSGNSDMPNTAGAVTDIDDPLRQKALKGSLSGFVYDDTNNNGIKEDGENGISGVNLSLFVWDEGLGEYVDTGKTAMTDEHGYYSFTELEAFKTYMISETQPSGYEDGSESVGTIEDMPADWEYGELPAIDNDTIGKIAMPAKGHGINYNFGEYKNGKISGFVKDDGDHPIADVEIELYDETGTKIAETKTDNDGYYEFVNLKPGTYTVKEKQPEDFCDGPDYIGTINGVTVGELPENDVISEIIIKSGDEGVRYDFYENRKGSISGFVYDDLNNNGIKEYGENGIGGVELSLWVWDKEQGKYVDTGKTATTDGDGYYIFDALCILDTYQVREVQPVGYEDGKETIGSLGGNQIANGNVDILSGIVMVVNGHGENYNFGEYKNGTISGSVKDDEGKPIPGTVIEIWEDGEKIGETKTDDDGNYSFDKLPPGNYTIKEQQPEKYCDSDDYVGTLGGVNAVNDVISEIVVKSGDEGEHYDFTENRKGFISGYVYIDANENGIKDSRESGIKGAVLTLWIWDEELGEYVDTRKTATTDANGFYKFDDLCPFNKYQIREMQPTGLIDGEETIGTVNGKESGTQTKNDIIGEIEMPPGGQGENYNFGELQPPSVPPPPGPPLSPPPYYVPPRPVGAIGQPGAAAGPNWQLPQIGEQLRSGYGSGGAAAPAQSWHLSVINAGYPRSNGSTDGIAVNEHANRTTMILSDTNDSNTADGVRYVSVAWTPMPMNQSAWYVRDRNGKVRKRFTFGPEGGIPLVGDFNGDGIANLAVFHNGNWYIDINGNGQWDDEDLWSELGSASDQPVVGDWDGDGKTDIGIFGPEWSGDQKIIANEPGLPTDLNTTVSSRPKNVPPDITISATMNNVRAMKHSETGGVRLDVVDHVFKYGNEGDRAFTGDFSGDGVTKIGIYRDGKWYIDRNGNGKWDEGDIFVDNTDFGLGAEGIPVVGDFNGDGIDNIGLFVDGVWHLDTTGDFKFDTRVEFGQVGDYPVVGDFEGDGIAQLAVYRAGREDSLQAGDFPKAAPAEGQGIFASQYTSDESGANGADQESLQHRGRSLHTPHTNAPLQRSR